MNKIKMRSLRFRTIILLFIMMLMLISMFVYNNYSALSLILKKVYSNTEDTVSLYRKHLDETLKRNETFLYTTAMDNRYLHALKEEDMNTTLWFNNQNRLNTTLKNALATYTTDGIFCYLPEQEQYITVNGNNGMISINIRKTILEQIALDTVDLANWSLLMVQGNYYFLRVLHIRDVYVGTWVGMATLQNVLAQNEDTNNQLYFTTPDGEVLRNGQPSLIIKKPEDKATPYEYENIDNEQVLAVSKRLNNAPFYLTVMVPERDLSNGSQDLVLVIIIVSFCALFMWLILAVAMEKWILRPVKSLTQAIDRLRSGDLKASAPTHNQPDEFQNMAVAFNDMVSQIQNLKIDVYERQLQKQRLEAQYLKQQITPHFMINCLNTTYQLTQTNHFDLARKMLKDLSQHLRFILSSGQTVSLGEEIRLVGNYIELSGIRYPYSIRYFCVCAEELYQATAIPLLLLNFVENTIKYEVRMGQVLEIHIEVKKIEKEQQTFIRARIWDTGSGFSSEILDKLANIDQYLEDEGEHIGIANVLMRARHVFELPRFTFTNRLGAGAQIDIELPYIPYTHTTT